VNAGSELTSVIKLKKGGWHENHHYFCLITGYDSSDHESLIGSYSQELCMEKLGGDPFFFYSIHKLYSFYYLRQAFRMV